MLYCPFQEKKACKSDCALYLKEKRVCVFFDIAESLGRIADGT